MQNESVRTVRFSDESEYLLHLLRCTLEGTVPENAPEGLSMERVLDIGLFHEVANVAFPALRRLPTPIAEDTFRRWQQAYAKAVNRDLAQSRARTENLYYLEDAMKDRADQAYIDAVLQKHGFYETKGDTHKYPERLMLHRIIPPSVFDGSAQISAAYNTLSVHLRALKKRLTNHKSDV